MSDTNHRVRFFMWCILARRISEGESDQTAVHDTAITYWQALNSVLIHSGDDLRIRNSRIEVDERHRWIMRTSRMVWPTVQRVSVEEMLTPVCCPDPTIRAVVAQMVFDALMMGTIVLTDEMRPLFERTAHRDPDPVVRAWARCILDPYNNIPPNIRKVE